MYSIKIAAKLVKIKQLYKKAEEQLSNFIVLSTYYLTFRLINGNKWRPGSGKTETEMKRFPILLMREWLSLCDV